MQLLLITGSGASHLLSAPDSEPIVMMEGWAAALRAEFGPQLSELIGLDRVTTGEDFEEHLGELTRWLQLKLLNERFAFMTSGTDSGRDNVVSQFQQALQFATQRGDRLFRALDVSLCREFGADRFDVDAAKSAYDRLLVCLGDGVRPERLVWATTNYDHSGALALNALGEPPRTGFSYDGVRKSKLSGKGLGTFVDRKPSMLWLHGAVGWYRDGTGSIISYPADDPYRPDLGRPAVLYPSKNKVIEESAVAQIWNELDAALRDSTHVFVLGHGLFDDHLVSRLRAVTTPLAVAVHSENDRARAETFLPEALLIQMTFGPDPEYDEQQIRAFATTQGQVAL